MFISNHICIVGNKMKNYKFILIIFSILTLGLILMITSLEMPAPHKKIIKSLDVDDVSVK
tara:strand:+ start:243 stop:422 length:180 start_codon:yes stop_codon:yes gene_type:complete